MSDIMAFQVSLASTWTLEDFKAAIVEDVSPPPVSDVNLKVFYLLTNIHIYVYIYIYTYI